MTDFIERDAQEVFEEEFLSFAGYNIQRRALPDVRDGIKWGARKLLHAQALGKLTYDKPFKKALKSVALATSFSYTHGDSSAYSTFIHMAKPFAMNVPLQEAKGNYGTLISSKDYSASRYVEMRGSEAASYLLKDLEKNTIIEWEDTYDMEGQFPKVLPAKGLWGLVNGCISIGTGMSCSVAPMNLRELNEALITLLWDKNAPDNKIIIMPDFPTGATLLNRDEVFESLKNGRGSACKVRATIEYNEEERCLVVKELPYSVYTNTICEELAALMETDENCGIADFADYTGEVPNLHIYLEKGARPEKVLRKLYKNTSLQSYYTINMMMLDGGKAPKLFGLREAMLAHLDHEIEVYTRSFQYDLNKIKARIHIIDGLMRAYDMIDEVIHAIKSSASSVAANQALQSLLSIDELQAKAILDLKLARLSKLDISKLRDERDTLKKEEERITAILNDETLLKREIERGLREVAEKFGNARRTKIMNVESENDEVTEVRQLQVSLTNQYNLFAAETSSLYVSRRGNAGSKLKLGKDEYVVSSITVNTNECILAFSVQGNVYSISAAQLEPNQKTSIYGLIGTKDDNEDICTIAASGNKGIATHVISVTHNGFIKKTNIAEYDSIRKTGTKAIKLDAGDYLVSAFESNNELIGIATHQGNFLMIDPKEITPIGRVSKGVCGIKLNNGDYVCAAHIIPSNTKSIVSTSTHGLIKQTGFSEFAAANRATKGARIHKIGDDDSLADFCAITDSSQVLVAASNSCIRLSVDTIPQGSRNTQGAQAIKLNSDSFVIAVTEI